MKWKTSHKQEKEVYTKEQDSAIKSDPLFSKKQKFYDELFNETPNPNLQAPQTSKPTPAATRITREEKSKILGERMQLRKKMFKEKTRKGQPIMNNYVNFLLFELENQDKLKKK